MLGASLIYVPDFSFKALDEIKQRIIENVKVQECLGNSIKCTTITKLNLNNWFNTAKTPSYAN